MSILRVRRSIWIPAFAGMTALVLFACSTVKLPDPIPQGAESWEIPVVPAKIENVVPQDVLSTGTDAPEVREAEMVITVPASEKPTHIIVKKRKTTLKQKALTNAPEHSVTADNPGVTAAQPQKSLFWRWVAVVIACLFILAGACMGIMNKVASFSPAGLIKRLVQGLGKKF